MELPSFLGAVTINYRVVLFILGTMECREQYESMILLQHDARDGQQ